MKNLVIPGTDIKCGSLCFGPATLGALIDEKTSFEILDYYAENGGNLLDTAHVYCDWLNLGTSTNEKLIGKWLTSRKMHHKMQIATKGGHYRFNTPEISRVTRQGILEDIYEGLENLQTDYIEFYWLHRDNLGLDVGEILEFLNEFKRMGLIKWFGGSNWTHKRLQEASTYAQSHSIQGLSAVQNLWTVAKMNNPPGDPTCVVCDKEDISFYEKTGLPLFAYTPQANGFFTKLDKLGVAELSDNMKNTYLNDYNKALLFKLKELAGKYECTINDIVLAYQTSQAFNCIPVFNCSNIVQLKEVMSNCEIRLTQTEISNLEA